MSNQDLKFTLRFNAETKSFVGEVKAADVAVDRLGNQATATGRQMVTMDRNSTQLSSGLGSLRNQVMALAGGFSVLYAAQNAKETLAQYQDLRTRIRALVGSEQAWVETEQYLISVSKEHNKSMLDMSDSMARLLTLEKSGLLTHDQTIALFEGMSNAASQNGASSAQLGQVMYGLQQALASGTVRAEEFNQVTEPMPDLLIQMADAAGVTVGGFRNMVNSGKVTSEFFANTLVKALESYEGAAAATADNINAKQAQVATSYTEMVAAFEEPISGGYGTVLDGLADSMDLIAENAELVSDVVGGTLVVAMGRGAAAVVQQTAEKIKLAIATRQELQATTAKTQAELNAVNAEIRHLEVMQVSNNQKFRAIGAEGALSSALSKRAALTNTLTAAQGRLNIVMAAGSGLMAALGGPLGVAMMAASAIAYFATQSDTAQKPTKDLTDKVSGLVDEYTELNKVGKQNFMVKLASDASDYRASLIQTRIKIREVKQEMEDAGRTGQYQLVANKSVELKQLTQQAKELETAVDTSNQAFDELLKKKTEGKWNSLDEGDGEDPPVNKDAEKQAEKLLANLQQQVVLYGKTSHLAKLNYDIESGALKSINAELAKKLRLAAADLDQKEAEAKSKKAVDSFYEETDQLNNAFQMRLAMEANMENQAMVQEQYAYDERLDNLTQHFQDAYALTQGNKEQMLALEQEYNAAKEMLKAEHELNMAEIERLHRERREEEEKGYWERYLESAEKTLGDFDALAESSINNFTSGMGNAFESMIFDSENLNDALNTMFEGMARSFVNSLGQMAAQWLAYQAVQALVNKEQQIQSLSTLSLNAQASALQAGLYAYSSTAAIPVYGPAMAPAAMKTALAITEPVATTITGLLSGGVVGQAHDGINRVPTSNEGTWLLKANEMVLNPIQADNFRWMVDMMQQMKTMQAAATTATAGSLASGGMPVSINVTGVDKSQVSSTAQVKDGQLQIDMMISQAVDASLAAMYEDADNGGPISKRLKQQ